MVILGKTHSRLCLVLLNCYFSGDEILAAITDSKKQWIKL